MLKRNILLFITVILSIVILNFNVHAEEETQNKEIVFESVTYNELTYENGKLKEKRTLNKDEYEKKVKEKKDEKKDEVNFPYVVDPCGLDGCGSGIPEKVVWYTPYPHTVRVECTLSDYIKCEGNAKTEKAYTTLRTKAIVYPNTNEQAYLKTELTWDIMPTYRTTDYMSLSWHHDQVILDKTKVKATRKINYYYEDYWYDTCSGSSTYNGVPICSGYHYRSGNVEGEVREYDRLEHINQFTFDNQNNGVIFSAPLVPDKIESNCGAYQVYCKEYSTSPGNIDGGYNTLTVNSMVFSLEAYLDLKGKATWKEWGIIEFAADYTHAYNTLVIDWEIGLDVSIAGPSVGLSLNPSIATQFDGTRVNYVQIKF